MKTLDSMLGSIKKNPKILVIIGLCGVLLIALSGIFTGGKGKAEQVKPTTTALTAAAYKEQLQEQVKEAITHLTGGKVNVVITLDSDIEYVYASEDKRQSKEQSNSGSDDNKMQKDSGSENSYVIVKDSEGNETPLVVTAVMPNVKGAVINCEGGDSADIKAAVTNIVMTALNVSEDKVCVLGYYE